MEVHQFRPSLPPPRLSVGVIGWLRSNLFSNWFNTLLTLLAIYLVWLIVPPLLQWAVFQADHQTPRSVREYQLVSSLEQGGQPQP